MEVPTIKTCAWKASRKGGVRMNKLNGADWAALILLIIGGLNWGLIGFFKFDLVAAIFGDMTTVSRIIYDLVGLSAIYILAMFASLRKQ